MPGTGDATLYARNSRKKRNQHEKPIGFPDAFAAVCRALCFGKCPSANRSVFPATRRRRRIPDHVVLHRTRRRTRIRNDRPVQSQRRSAGARHKSRHRKLVYLFDCRCRAADAADQRRALGHARGWARVTSTQPIGATEVFQAIAGGQVISQAGVLPSDLTGSSTLFVPSPPENRPPPESQHKTPTATSRNPRNGAAILAAPRLILLCSASARDV
jgi:hypothetical protein